MNRSKAKSRREGGTFFRFPHAVMDSENYTRLSSHAVRLLHDLCRQFNGRNNGDLCAAWTLIKPRGWKSRSTLNKAIKELLHYGLITLTRQGGSHKPNLYAVTWLPIDECQGKLDASETRVATGEWKEKKLTLR